MDDRDDSAVGSAADEIIIKAGSKDRIVPLICASMMVAGVGIVIASGINNYWLAAVFIVLFALMSLALVMQVPRFWRVGDDGIEVCWWLRRRFFPWADIDVFEDKEDCLIFRRRKSLFSLRIPKRGSLGAEEPLIERNINRRSEEIVESIGKGGAIDVEDYPAKRWHRVIVGVCVFCFLWIGWCWFLAGSPAIFFKDTFDGIVLIVSMILLVVMVFWGQVRKTHPLKLAPDGVSIFCKRVPIRIGWDEVKIERKGNELLLGSSGEHDKWFTLKDSMTNYHAARLLLRRKGLIPE